MNEYFRFSLSMTTSIVKKMLTMVNGYISWALSYFSYFLLSLFSFSS